MLISEKDLFRLPSAVPHDPAVDAWLGARSDAPGLLAREWFNVLRQCGADVRELVHDGGPVACVEDAAFAYVNAFTAHTNIGFFYGAFLADPKRLLSGTGKRMRHVKLRPGDSLDAAALRSLVDAAYRDIRSRLTNNNRRT
jgi:hypothetical protein